MCEYFYFYFFSLLLACLLAAGRVLCSHACASTERLVEQSLAGKQLVDAHAAPLSKPSDAVLAEKGWVGTGGITGLGCRTQGIFDWGSLFLFGLFTFR